MISGLIDNTPLSISGTMNDSIRVQSPTPLDLGPNGIIFIDARGGRGGRGGDGGDGRDGGRGGEGGDGGWKNNSIAASN